MLQKITASAMKSPMYRNRYYGMGLSLQKGLPVALIPVFVFVFGESIYAQYVLFFSVVQVYAVVTSIGIPQSVVPLWFRQEKHDEFFASVILLVLGLGLAFAPFGLVILRTFVAPEINGGPPDLLAVVIVSFALLYNSSALATAAARARDQQGPFFWSIVAGAVALTLIILGAYTAGLTTLYELIAAQAAALVISILIISRRDILRLFAFDASACVSHARKMFNSSLPVYGYTITTMYVLSVDKWAVKILFVHHEFVNYVINYQFAFSILFVPTAIVFYLGPRFSQLASSGHHDEVRRLEAKARRMALSFSVFLSVAIYVYGAVTGVKVTAYYWLLVAGFLVHGLYLITSSRFMAYLNFKSMLAVNLVSSAAFTGCLVAAALTRQIVFVYVTWIVYASVALVLSALVARHRSVGPALQVPTIDP